MSDYPPSMCFIIAIVIDRDLIAQYQPIGVILQLLSGYPVKDLLRPFWYVLFTALDICFKNKLLVLIQNHRNSSIAVYHFKCDCIYDTGDNSSNPLSVLKLYSLSSYQACHVTYFVRKRRLYCRSLIILSFSL